MEPCSSSRMCPLAQPKRTESAGDGGGHLSDRTKEDARRFLVLRSYNGNTPGNYTFEGTLSLTSGIRQPQEP